MFSSESGLPAAVSSQPSRGRKRESVRAAVLEAAATLLARGGAGALTMRALARRVGVSAPTIYSHFRDKEDLLGELVTQGFKALAESLQEARKAARSSHLEVVIAAYGEFADQNSALFDLMFHPSAATSGGGEQLLAEEFRLALTDERSATRALAVWALVHGASALHRAGRIPLGADRRRAVASMLQAFLDPRAGLDAPTDGL